MPKPCRAEHGDRRPGCRVCELAATRADYAALWGEPAPDGSPPPAARTLPCVHEGDVLRPCGSCAGDRAEARHVRGCDLFGECARGEPVVPRVCAACDRYAPDPSLLPPPAPPPAPLSLVEVGPEGLAKGQSGYAFNAGLVRYQGRLLMSYRTDWAGAHCHVAELAEDYTPQFTRVLPELAHPRANVGREDPRLFVFRGRLHVAYIGVERAAGGGVVTNQMYARLTDDLRVEEVFYPEYQYRRAWEKNWQFFEWAGELFAVYSIAPHVVLHVLGNKAYPFAETPTPFAWSGGHLRGGAPPVLVGDRFYHWFHGRRDAGWVYNVGLYAFEARPPFRVLGLTPDPLLAGDPAATDGNYCPVTFPQGAVLEGGRWKVAMGWNDRKVKIGEWDAAAVDRALGLP